MDEQAKTRPDTIWVRKASGEEEVFEIAKIERSLKNAGAGGDLLREVMDDLAQWVYNGVTTKKIYSRAFSLLRKKKSISALRYKLKQSMLELGPTGYPFEQFIGFLFQKQGYEVEVGQVLEGCCVTHEMDVIATKEKQQQLVECKYGVSQGKQISVQVPLYVRSRVDDIVKKRKELPQYNDFSFTGWVVTNTRFSGDSISFSECSGLELLGWDFPAGRGLKELIEKENLYPITILANLTKKEKQQLIEQGIVICEQLHKSPELIANMQLANKKHRLLLQELKTICS